MIGLFRRRPATDHLPPDWKATLTRRFAHFSHLDDDGQDLLGEYAGELVRSKHWEAANGFSLDDEMRLLIAAQAALLVLGLSMDHYREVGAIIVHPTTVVLRGEHGSPVEGLMSDEPTPVLGEAADRGPLLVAWDAVSEDLHHPWCGHNVVFHEFAHKIDMLDELVDGTPPMPAALLGRWTEVCGREYESVQHGDDELLDDYAGVNEAEFFAVATEAFFDLPDEMARLKPDLYDVFSAFYRQDPASRAQKTPL